MIIKKFKDFIEAIDEGLIKTNEPQKILDYTLHTLCLMDVDIDGYIKDGEIEIVLDNFNFIHISQIEMIFDIILSNIVNMGGYFPTEMCITNIHRMKKTLKYDFQNLLNNHKVYKEVLIKFEANFGEEVKNIPSKLYHLSIKEYENKILKYGLIPRSKSKLKSHIDRIYLCENIADCSKLAPTMKFYYSIEKDENIYKNGKILYNKDTCFVIFEIDNSDGIVKKLYKDPKYSNGYYTINNIPHKYIKKIVEFVA